jgi:thioredoxin 2
MNDVPRGPLQVVCPHCDAVNRVPAARLRGHPACGRCHGALFTGHPVLLTAANFDTHVARGSLPLVVDFWAQWCGPCRAMAPVFEQAAQVLEPGVRLAKLNTEEAPEVAARWQVRSIPTLILFRDGREAARQAGAMPGAMLMEWIRRNAG